MDKNEAWATMVAGINCPDVAPTETIALIQLDSYKAGLSRAAVIIDEWFKSTASKSDGRPYTLDLQRIQRSIREERDRIETL